MFRSTGSAILIALAISFAASCKTWATETPTTRPVVIVELFTSEGCSSCPPADNVLADLATQNAVDGVQIIPLGMHVDYWNYLGWGDRFSSPQFSDRQQRYSQIFNSNEVYTPQMIVDGTEQFVGSDRQKAIAAIVNSAAQPKGTIAINLMPDSKDESSVACKISVDGIDRNGGRAMVVMLAITEDDLSSDVPRGENAGQTLHHAAVVRTLRRVATINPTDTLPFSASTMISIQPTWRADHIHIAIFVQDPQSGKILAGGYQRIASPPEQK